MTAMAISPLADTPVLDGLRIPKFDLIRWPLMDRTEIWPVSLSAPAIHTFTDLATMPASGVLAELTVSSRTIGQSYGSVVVTPSADVAQLLAWLTEVTAPTAPADLDVVDTIVGLTIRLGVPQATIFEATGISKRTFHHWKKNRATTPRAGSAGSLWSLVRATADLEEHLETKSVAIWLREHPDRLAALKAGNFRRLVDEATGALAIDPKSVAHREAGFIDAAADPSVMQETRTETKTYALGADQTPKVVLD